MEEGNLLLKTETMKREDIYIQLVSDKTLLPIELIKSKKRKREICEARQVCSYILLKHTELNSIEIAKKLHYKSHTSPLRDKKQVALFLSTDRKFTNKYQPIVNDAMSIALRFLRIENTTHEQKPLSPGDTCWFWNLWSRYPIIGTYRHSYIGENGEQIYICSEYPRFSFSNCQFVAEEILPESFRKSLKEVLKEAGTESLKQAISA
jgi:hypothetical protein